MQSGQKECRQSCFSDFKNFASKDVYMQLTTHLMCLTVGKLLIISTKYDIKYPAKGCRDTSNICNIS